MQPSGAAPSLCKIVYFEDLVSKVSTSPLAHGGGLHLMQAKRDLNAAPPTISDFDVTIPTGPSFCPTLAPLVTLFQNHFEPRTNSKNHFDAAQVLGV